MDITSVTFAGLMTLGFVNVVTFYKPELDSKVKFFISFLFALAVLFIPSELGNMLLDKMKEAIEIALAASGTYKLLTKAGGN
jgi:hypothetical protein